MQKPPINKELEDVPNSRLSPSAPIQRTQNIPPVWSLGIYLIENTQVLDKALTRVTDLHGSNSITDFAATDTSGGGGSSSGCVRISRTTESTVGHSIHRRREDIRRSYIISTLSRKMSSSTAVIPVKGSLA